MRIFLRSFGYFRFVEYTWRCFILKDLFLKIWLIENFFFKPNYFRTMGLQVTPNATEAIENASAWTLCILGVECQWFYRSCHVGLNSPVKIHILIFLTRLTLKRHFNRQIRDVSSIQDSRLTVDGKGKFRGSESARWSRGVQKVLGPQTTQS